MKKKHGLFASLVLFVITLFLPWFTYNPKVMGYCWGTQYVLYFIIPVVLVGTYIFSAHPRLVSMILAEFGSVMQIALLVVIFGTWQEGRNIAAGFRWLDGFRTAQPGFWLAAACTLLTFILLQCNMGRNKVC